MSPLRLAILVGFVGATCWVYVTYQGTGHVAFTVGVTDQATIERLSEPLSRVRAVKNELVVVTVAAVAWILAGLVKLKA